MSWILIALACGPEVDSAVTPAPSPCDEESRADALEPGLVGTPSAGVWTVAVDAADPTPARSGANRWELSVAGGVTGCELTASTWMPDHGHGGPTPLTSELGGGRYALDLELTMGGLWEVTVELTCDGEPDAALFAICAES